MKTEQFPYLAGGMGAFLLLLVMTGSTVDQEGVTTLPLLTLLIVNEFAFFVTAIGGIIGVRHIMAATTGIRYKLMSMFCLLLSAVFIWQGLKLWPW